MSASSSRKVDKVEQVTQRKVRQPRWLEPLLEKSFFDPCADHPMPKNKLNRYCTTCNRSACQYCISSTAHNHHKILRVFKHVYKSVVPLAAMEKCIDCSQIQPYKCNRRLVIALNPLPHSDAALNDEVLCEICGRGLTEPDSYRYCSISCKVKAVARKPNDSVPPFITIQSRLKKGEENTSEPPKLTRKRKGTPHRAPFF